MAGADGVARRTVLRGLGVLGLAAALPGCSAQPFAGTGLVLATGSRVGNYYKLGTGLAQAWRDELGISTDVAETAGSVANLDRLATGRADVAMSQVDSATERLRRTAADDPQALRALARIYDDVVHVVVRDDLRATPSAGSSGTPALVTTVGQLRGKTVSVGQDGSGVFGIAQRLLGVAGLVPGRDLRTTNLGIDASAEALVSGAIDAFFWSGGLPTPRITSLVLARPIRLLDLEDILGAVRDVYPEYAALTVPARTYGIPTAISTLIVRNFLVVAASMPDELAYELVQAVFRRGDQVADVLPLALTIERRRAIGTQPVPLHDGAKRYYVEAKDS